MNLETQRRLIAQKSPIHKMVDPRPTCETCGRVLTRRDFEAYWDGAHEGTPACCERCAERDVKP